MPVAPHLREMRGFRRCPWRWPGAFVNAVGRHVRTARSCFPQLPRVVHRHPLAARSHPVTRANSGKVTQLMVANTFILSAFMGFVAAHIRDLLHRKDVGLPIK